MADRKLAPCLPSIPLRSLRCSPRRASCPAVAITEDYAEIPSSYAADYLSHRPTALWSPGDGTGVPCPTARRQLLVRTSLPLVRGFVYVTAAVLVAIILGIGVLAATGTDLALVGPGPRQSKPEHVGQLE